MKDEISDAVAADQPGYAQKRSANDALFRQGGRNEEKSLLTYPGYS